MIGSARSIRVDDRALLAALSIESLRSPWSCCGFSCSPSDSESDESEDDDDPELEEEESSSELELAPPFSLRCSPSTSLTTVSSSSSLMTRHSKTTHSL